MSYESITLQEDLVIDKIVTIHYFEYMSNFYFSGESHNFWEFLCVDKGEVNVLAGSVEHTLERGDIIFHKPNEFHNVKANGKIAPNLVVVAFECDSPAMDFFRDKILNINDRERQLLGLLISEAKNAFSSRLDDPKLQKLERSSHPSFGGEQLIRQYLSQFLIELIRRTFTAPDEDTPFLSKSMKQKNDTLIYTRVLAYLEENIYTHVTIEQICHANLVGRSQLQKIFRERNNCGIIDYFSKMKINAAKQMIRDNHLNFTQISDSLGYTSIHYFSRQFKKVTGMTPSEYASSIKVISETDYK